MQEFDMLESKIYTIIKTKVNKAMSIKYPTISFANEPSNTEPVFPNVFFQQLQPVETGQDIEGSNINAILDTVQIQVTTNTSKADAKSVAWACVDALKSIRYNVVGMPLYSIQIKESTRIHTYSLRASRVIGAGDLI